MNAQAKRWSENDTKRLQEVFKKGEADPNNCTKENINLVHGKYFSTYSRKNFTATFKRHASKFLIDASLQGARAKGMFFED